MLENMWIRHPTGNLEPPALCRLFSPLVRMVYHFLGPCGGRSFLREMRVADSLYLSLWFQNYEDEKMLDGLAAVLRSFPFSEEAKGVSYVSVQPVSWSESSVFEHRFTPPVAPLEAVDLVVEYAAEDYAICFEAWWDLWLPPEDGGEWVLTPVKVSFTAQGREFDEGIYAEQGHVQIDFGIDEPFVHEEALPALDEKKLQANIATLAAYAHRIEQSCELAGKNLWSDSDSNLAQKLIARLEGGQ